MKKRKVILSAMTIVSMAIIGYHGMRTFSIENENQNPLLLRNIEALSDPSEEHKPCDNVNGYRQWSSSGFLRVKKEFYDCCYGMQQGYNPQDNCRK